MIPASATEDDFLEFAKRFPTYASFAAHLYSRIHPSELTLFEPRRIVPPGGYHSPKVVAGSLYTILGEIALKLRADEFVAPLEITAQSIAYQVVDERVPIYYVADEFCRAVAATDLPDGFTLDELRWPTPAMVLGFPPKFMQEYIGSEICYVLCARTNAGDHKCRLIPHAPTTVLPRDRIAWVWFREDDSGKPNSYVSSYARQDPINEAILKYGYVDYTSAPQDVIDRNKETTDKVSALILKLLCVLNWRDSLIEHGVCLRKECIKKGEKRDALWSANIIGGKYRIQREAPTGTHASPRLHRRRGHWTYQPIGKKEDFIHISALPRTEVGEIDWTNIDTMLREKFFKSHKRHWLEPIWIGLGS